MSFVPVVIEQSSKGERSFDIFSRLLRERIIFLGTAIDDMVFSEDDKITLMPSHVTELPLLLRILK